MENLEEIKPVGKLLNEVKDGLIEANPINIALADYRLKPLSELMEERFDPINWIVDRLVPSEGIIAIAGDPASFKTWLILDMAQKIASGTLLFNKFPTKQTGVLLVDEENGDRSLQSRFKMLGNKFDLPIHTLSFNEFKLTSDSVKKLVRTAEKKDIGLIIFDSLVRIHNADENSAIAMAGVLALLKRITMAGITVIFTHHHKKKGNGQSNGAQDMRGSSDILASLDSQLSIEKEGGEEYIIVKHNKSRHGKELGSFKLDIVEDQGNMSFELNGDIEITKSKRFEVQEIITKLLTDSTEQLCKADIFELAKQNGLKAGNSTFKKILDSMIRKGLITEKKGEKNKTYCFLTNKEVVETPLVEPVKNTDPI
jgi:RecA-family ATPase